MCNMICIWFLLSSQLNFNAYDCSLLVYKTFYIFKPKTLYGNFLALQKCKLKCSLWEKLFLYFKIRVYGNKKFFNFLNRIDD